MKPPPRSPSARRLFRCIRPSLGDGIDTAWIDATYENGVLTVTIPMAERAKPRRIAVGHGGTAKPIAPTATNTVDAE